MNDYKLAEQVHREVNASVTYKTDAAQFSRPEHWVPAGRYGDCEDYALLKRQKLLDAGWPSSKLSLCTCLVGDEGHCVLYAETDRGGFILDNLQEWPARPTSLPYQWISILCDGSWRALVGWR